MGEFIVYQFVCSWSNSISIHIHQFVCIHFGIYQFVSHRLCLLHSLSIHQTSHWICSSRAENFIRCSSLQPLDWTPICPLGRLYLWLAEAGDWLSCLLQNQVNIQKTSCLSRRCRCPCASHESPAGVSYQPSQCYHWLGNAPYQVV